MTDTDLIATPVLDVPGSSAGEQADDSSQTSSPRAAGRRGAGLSGMVLAELRIDGRSRKVLMQANKNGFFYVLDRETGQFHSGQAFAKVTWASGVTLEQDAPLKHPARGMELDGRRFHRVLAVHTTGRRCPSTPVRGSPIYRRQMATGFTARIRTLAVE